LGRAGGGMKIVVAHFYDPPRVMFITGQQLERFRQYYSVEEKDGVIHFRKKLETNNLG